MNLLVLNAGSSSVKFRLYRDGDILLDGMVDRIGPKAQLVMGGAREEMPAPTHEDAGRSILCMAQSHGRIDAVAHRIVHGLDRAGPCVLTPTEIASLRELLLLSPLHQKHCLALVELCARETDAVQVGVFDTMFHRTMPPVARTYAIPPDVARKHRIERYGFHGIAHVAMRDAALSALGRDAPGTRIITCQLGSGASLCAIRDGCSVDTTMGFTPLEGLVMGTRSGSIDPAIAPFLCGHGMTPAQVREMLGKESGLLAIGGSNDVRDLLAREATDEKARLALDMFAYSFKKHLGGLLATLGGADAIVLGGGVSQSPVMRRRCLSGLEMFGIALDEAKLLSHEPCEIGSGPVRVLVVDVDEAEEMRKLALPLL